MNRMADWKKLVSKNLPVLTSMKREGVALRDSVLRIGGSQCGEDRWIIEYLTFNGIDLKRVRYVEVGANQPSQLSNTWGLYQKGAEGILVEPDPRCSSLLRRWRPRDIVIEALAGSEGGVGTLLLHKHTTMNAEGDAVGGDYIDKRIVPIITLDGLLTEIQKSEGFEEVHLLSVDTEGADLNVLRGAREMLKVTKLVCLEHWRNPTMLAEFQAVLGPSFIPKLETDLNIVFAREGS